MDDVIRIATDLIEEALDLLDLNELLLLGLYRRLRVACGFQREAELQIFKKLAAARAIVVTAVRIEHRNGPDRSTAVSYLDAMIVVRSAGFVILRTARSAGNLNSGQGSKPMTRYSAPNRVAPRNNVEKFVTQQFGQLGVGRLGFEYFGRDNDRVAASVGRAALFTPGRAD